MVLIEMVLYGGSERICNPITIPYCGLSEPMPSRLCVLGERGQNVGFRLTHYSPFPLSFFWLFLRRAQILAGIGNSNVSPVPEIRLKGYFLPRNKESVHLN